MQFDNLHNWHGHNSSLANSDDASSLGQGSLMDGSADAPLVSWAAPQEYLMDASGQVSTVLGTTTHSATTSSTTTATGSPPAPTLVGSPAGLQFDLIWDASVTNAPRGFMQAIVDAAKFYSTLYSNRAVIAMMLVMAKSAARRCHRLRLVQANPLDI